ncbi:MAG: diacylglycerol/polyprenol kinase family protein [Bacteriovoracaceae bacterium]
MAIFTLENLKVSLLPSRTDMHLLRKIWHMATGSVAVALFFLSGQDQQTWGWVALGLAFLGFSADFIRLRYPKANEFAIKFMGIFMRESERNDYSGLPFYSLGCGLALLLYSSNIAVISVLFLVFSDPISSYFGVKYGKEKILPNKSLQGTTAGFCTCYLITLVYGICLGNVSFDLLLFALLAGAVGAISELFSVMVDDNLTIPVVSGLGLTGLNMFFHIL